LRLNFMADALYIFERPQGIVAQNLVDVVSMARE
jgi:hypothetical protein